MFQTLKSKVMLVIAVACVVCTVGAVIIAGQYAHDSGLQKLREKSEAILTRLEAARSFIALQGAQETIMKQVGLSFHWLLMV